MSESTSSLAGRIFISYRREETGYAAGWLYDRLTARFGGGQVFKDVDSIQLGDDFVEVITHAVGSCDVLLALIDWLRENPFGFAIPIFPLLKPAEPQFSLVPFKTDPTAQDDQATDDSTPEGGA